MKKTFSATILSNDDYKNAAYVDIPFDVEEVYGKKRVKIIALFDDTVEYRGSLVRMGGECHMLLLRKDVRAALGKSFGDTVKIELKEDTEPRVVKVPEDVMALLQQYPDQLAFYQKMSYTHQKEYIQWIEEAKRSETRERRMHKMIEMLQAGKKGR